MLSAAHVRRALERLPDIEIINGYGPTETTTFATMYRVPRDLPADSRSIPIGMPIGNTTVHLLDGMGRLVPAGVPGELYIGGPGVALGYWERPESTAERFVPDPFDPSSGRRWYRTGDLGRRRLDGNIEFLGRLDGQVKVRGFRIEPGEIEAGLRRHDAVRDAIVVPVEEPTGPGVRLVAYVVPRTDAGADGRSLARFPQGDSPRLYGPLGVRRAGPVAAFAQRQGRSVPVAAPGCIAHGRRSRSRPPLARRSQAGRHVRRPARAGPGRCPRRFLRARGALAPGDAGRLARPAGDGHRAATDQHLREADGGGLAEMVEDIVRAGADGHRLPMLRRPRPGTFPLLWSQQSIWDLEQRYPGRTNCNASRAYRLRGPLSLGALHDSIAALVDRHEALRSNFARIDGSPAQIINSPNAPEIPSIDLSRLPEASRMVEAQRFFDAESWYRFESAVDPLFRTRLLRLDDDDHF